MIFIVVLYNIINAAIHAGMIKKYKTIDHFAWAVGYGLFVALICAFTGEWFPISLFCILSRKPVFDISLNLMRGKSAWYVSKSTTSKIDLFIIKHSGLSPVIYQPLLVILSIVTLLL